MPAWPELERRLGESPLGDRPQPRDKPGWQVDPGRYELHIGRSATDIAHVVQLAIAGSPFSSGT